MPQVRSLRGGQSPFSPAKVSATISQAYLQIHRAHTVRFRKQIQEHTQRVIATLKATLGDGQKADWTRQAIAQAIEGELRAQAPAAVYEAYLTLHPTATPTTADAWDRIEPLQTEAGAPDDPQWSILWPRTLDDATPAAAPPGAELGHEIRPKASSPRRGRARTQVIKRSMWLAFWRDLADTCSRPMDVTFLLDLALQDQAQHAMTPEAWWRHWQRLLDQAMLDDPRLADLVGALERRRHMTLALGASWLADSPLSPETVPLLRGEEGRRRYQQLWVRHMLELDKQKEIRHGLIQRYPLKELALTLDPARDDAIDWRGWTCLVGAGALWPILPGAWDSVGAEAREFPQWAFLRMAMEAALNEADPIAWAQRFYAVLSQRQVVLVDALREAGQARPAFLEDQTGRVGDDFKAIYDAIHLAAIATKWNGTVALDWRQVRAKGAPIAGKRTSQGVVGFWQSLDQALAAQGRFGNDRPVTVALPLWHREALDILDLRETRTSHLQPTLLIPDLFFERLAQQGRWRLFDPAVFPEVRDGSEAGYLAAEAAMPQRRKAYPHAVAEIGADRLWRRLVKAMVHGSPFLVFEGAQLAAASFPQSAPPNVGLDGVGALPLPMKSEALTSTHWASAAINLAQCVDDTGQPQVELIREWVQVGLRLLDNLTMRSEGKHPEPMRSVCLGAIGYYEAIEQASAHVRHDPHLVGAWATRLAEVWHTTVQKANRDLAQERGRAPGWAVPDARPHGPQVFRDRLRTARKGQLPSLARSATEETGTTYDERHNVMGGRFVACSVWAPFENAARVAGTTPGGIGTLYPLEHALDLDGQPRLFPTPFLLHHVHQDPDHLDSWAMVLAHPAQPQRWPEAVARLSHPDREAWEDRLHHAALMRPWLEQGVSLTLPVHLPEPMLGQLVHRAWWLGLNSIRFAHALGAPEAPAMTEDVGMDNPDEGG